MTQFELEDLIQAVTDAVMRALGEPGASLSEPRGTALDAPSRPTAAREDGGRRFLVIVPLPTANLASLARGLESLLIGGNRVTALLEPHVKNEAASRGLLQSFGPDVADLGNDTASQVIAGIAPGDLVVVGSLGFDLARGILELADSDPAVRIVTQALLRGNRVVTLSDDLTPPAGVNNAVTAKAARTLRDLEGAGLTVLPLKDLAILAEDLAALDRTESRAFGGLVTEADVEAFAAGGGKQIDLPARTVVTPLASSRAVELGVAIRKKA